MARGVSEGEGEQALTQNGGEAGRDDGWGAAAEAPAGLPAPTDAP